jgi:hypothetical protein
MRRTTKGFSHKKYLDGELLFRKYHALGRAKSVTKLQKWCKENVLVNQDTGKAPTHMALWFAMWRWALRPENQGTAREIYNQYLFDCLKPELDDLGWRELMLKRAKTCFNSGFKDNSFFNWKRENGYGDVTENPDKQG